MVPSAPAAEAPAGGAASSIDGAEVVAVRHHHLAETPLLGEVRGEFHLRARPVGVDTGLHLGLQPGAGEASAVSVKPTQDEAMFGEPGTLTPITPTSITTGCGTTRYEDSTAAPASSAARASGVQNSAPGPYRKLNRTPEPTGWAAGSGGGSASGGAIATLTAPRTTNPPNGSLTVTVKKSVVSTTAAARASGVGV